MDTRTRERLPVLPTMVAWVAAERARTAELLAAAEQTLHHDNVGKIRAGATAVFGTAPGAERT